MICPTLHQRLCRLLLLLPLQGCAAATLHPDETINLLACGQPVDLSCDERRSSYSILPSTRPPVVDGDGRPRSAEASRLPKDSEHWRPEDAALAERVASGMLV